MHSVPTAAPAFPGEGAPNLQQPPVNLICVLRPFAATLQHLEGASAQLILVVPGLCLEWGVLLQPGPGAAQRQQEFRNPVRVRTFLAQNWLLAFLRASQDTLIA